MKNSSSFGKTFKTAPSGYDVPQQYTDNYRDTWQPRRSIAPNGKKPQAVDWKNLLDSRGDEE